MTVDPVAKLCNMHTNIIFPDSYFIGKKMILQWINSKTFNDLTILCLIN